MNLNKYKIDKYKLCMVFIVVFGLLLRICYISKTSIYERQHDVFGIADSGHLGYIYTIYENEMLPSTNEGQFYHPPLFHLTSALWLRLETLIGIDFDSALEGIQVLTLIYSMLILLVVYLILKRVKIKDSLKLLIMLVMSVHPTFIILSGSINNDILTILLMFLIILYLVKWYENTNLRNTIILAIVTGLCVMTKSSRCTNGFSNYDCFCFKNS